MTPYSVLNLPPEERPRERLERYGAEIMSTAELIAVILGTGTKGSPVLQLANELVSRFGSIKGLAEATLTELKEIRGLGHAKAIQLKAAFSLGIRLSSQNVTCKYLIDNSMHAYQLVKEELANEKREVFLALLLDAKGYLICQQTVSIGTLTQTLVHPREVFYPAIRHKAASIILAHNHPSGDPTPSQDDHEVTTQLVSVGKLISIPVHDHIIIGDGKFISMRQTGFKF